MAVGVHTIGQGEGFTETWDGGPAPGASQSEGRHVADVNSSGWPGVRESDSSLGALGTAALGGDSPGPEEVRGIPGRRAGGVQPPPCSEHAEGLVWGSGGTVGPQEKV